LRRTWIRPWLADVDLPALPLLSTVDLKWSGEAEDWTRRTQALKAAADHAWRAWRDALVAAGFATKEELAGVRSGVYWKVEDHRRDQAQPLPAMPR